jgi:hypothetical protein
MTARSKVQNICLSQLVLSPANVRKTAATAAEDAALEASIRARGILQNLIVHPAPVDGKSVYEVDAGGRRLRILQKLAAEGVIDLTPRSRARSKNPKTRSRPRSPKTRCAPRCIRPTSSSPWRP